MTTMTDPRPEVAHCLRCDGTEHLIEGDGHVVCRPCVDLLGGIAANPESADNHILTALLERHGDAVKLSRAPEVRGRVSPPLRWDWIAPWPGAEPRVHDDHAREGWR